MKRTKSRVKDAGPAQISRIWIATLVLLLALLVSWSASARASATEQLIGDSRKPDGEDSLAFVAHMQTSGLLPAESSERVIRAAQRGRSGR